MVLFILLISCSLLALSVAQSCGSVNSCTQQYDVSCPDDDSTTRYETCFTSQSSCNQPIGPADSLSVDCYDTCIVGTPTSLQLCCANSILAPETISLTTNPQFLIARLFSPNSPNAYPSNRFCTYNIKCPNSSFFLQYNLIRFNLEPPVNGQCLDFLRYRFTEIGTTVPSDACGDLNSLPNVLKSGPHGSSLTVEFRSNRITTGVDFFLALTCTLPLAQSSNGLVASQTGTGWIKCTPSQNLAGVKVGTYPSRIISAKQYLSGGEFMRKYPHLKVHYYITVTRAGVVVYKDNTITVVQSGRIQHRFRNIKLLQVHNRIEGHLRFYGRATPQGRTFPGHGFLQVKSGIVQYVQTIIDPRFLLNAEEESIVQQLYREIFVREQIGTKRANRLQHPGTNQKVNCIINKLAELNVRSCTSVVRAAATFFLRTDTFQDFCKLKWGTYP